MSIASVNMNYFPIELYVQFRTLQSSIHGLRMIITPSVTWSTYSQPVRRPRKIANAHRSKRRKSINLLHWTQSYSGSVGRLQFAELDTTGDICSGRRRAARRVKSWSQPTTALHAAVVAYMTSRDWLQTVMRTNRFNSAADACCNNA